MKNKPNYETAGWIGIALGVLATLAAGSAAGWNLGVLGFALVVNVVIFYCLAWAVWKIATIIRSK